MIISVLHPTRRPERALAIRNYWLARTCGAATIEWIFGIDEDDAASLLALCGELHTISKAGGGCVRAINAAAAIAKGDILMVAADDLYAPQDWDRMLRDALAGYALGVLNTRDGRRADGLVTHPAITRGWYRSFGYFFPPAFKSVYADTWLTEQAWRVHAMVSAPPECVFEHRHPDFGDVETDAVYQAGSTPARYEEGWRVLNELLPQKISLCMICGNEASVIIRCLDSAKGAFDELCLVRAVGALPRDITAQLAKTWCEANGKEFKFSEYYNRVLGWFHVDDFGAARNLSFSLGTGDWLLWLDCDDVLDEINCRRIREAAFNREFDALYCSYLVQEGGAELERERMIRPEAGHWQGAVHEVCVISGKAAHCPQIKVFHRQEVGPDGPPIVKHAGRNAVILERATEDAGRHFFYLHADLKLLGRKGEAIRAGQAALILLEPAQVEERYQVRLNLSDLEPERRAEHLMEALRLQPHRREALAYLAETCLLAGDLSGATSWFRMMDGLPVPAPMPWTHQGLWYPDLQGNGGWGRKLLRVRILHAAGKRALALEEHQKYLLDPDYAAHAAGKLRFTVTATQGCESYFARDCPVAAGDGKEPGRPDVQVGGQGLPMRAE